jgi:polyhydroxyalkanoate synthesis regulator phasin
MAAADETRRKIQEQINKLLSDEQLVYKSMLRDLDARNASEQEYIVLLKSVKREFDDISSSLSSISSILADNVNELTKGREAINQSTSATRKLNNITSHLLSIRKGEASYDQKKLNSLKRRS